MFADDSGEVPNGLIACEHEAMEAVEDEEEDELLRRAIALSLEGTQNDCH